jgi:hypothetical protein
MHMYDYELNIFYNTRLTILIDLGDTPFRGGQSL